jgi:hypothetical protein
MYGVATFRQVLPFLNTASCIPKSPHIISGNKHDLDPQHGCPASRDTLPVFGSYVGRPVSPYDELGPEVKKFCSDKQNSKNRSRLTDKTVRQNHCSVSANGSSQQDVSPISTKEQIRERVVTRFDRVFHAERRGCLLIISTNGTRPTWSTGGDSPHLESWAESYCSFGHDHDTLLGC